VSDSVSPAEARRTYREAWSRYLLCGDEGERERLGQVMDSLQSSIARGPTDPAWAEFADSLPGFRDYWLRWRREATARFARLT
jgi:hypothetical protein